MSTKGEAVALAIAQMTTSTIATCDHGVVTKTKRVILERDVYDRKWKLGPFAKKKENLKSEGKLDKYGRINDTTPEAWKLLFGEPEKPTKVEDVANKLGVSKNGSAKDIGKKTDDKKPAKKVEKSDESEEESDEEIAKKKKKDKKETKKADKKVKKADKKEKKKEKKAKKKAAGSSDEDEESDD